MPLYDVECPKGHRAEVFISYEERDKSVEEHGDVVVPCETEGCTELARKDQIQQTGNMAIQWKRAAHGESTK